MKILAIVGLFLATQLNAAEIRIGYVDLQKALHSVNAGKKAKKRLERESKKLRQNLEKQEASLRKEVEAFQKKAGILNERAKAKKQAELQKKAVELQQKMQASQVEFRRLENELTAPLVKELRAIVDALGREKSFHLILNKNEASVLYSKGGTELTDTVIKRFNKTRKKG